jgi:hypothetical protein
LGLINQNEQLLLVPRFSAVLAIHSAVTSAMIVMILSEFDFDDFNDLKRVPEDQNTSFRLTTVL